MTTPSQVEESRASIATQVDLRDAYAAAASSVMTGELLALLDHRRTALVSLAGMATQIVLARTTVELQPQHIGRTVVMLNARLTERLTEPFSEPFSEPGARAQPIVIGLLRDTRSATLPAWPRLDHDGERTTVEAETELTLRCGKASITLRSDGKVEIRGETIVSQAVGANRIRGGSVQLN